MKLLIFLTTMITIIHVDLSRCKLRKILQLTIRSTIAVTVFPIPLLTTRVQFLVSVHIVFSMVNVAVFTEISVFNICFPSYQDAFDKGLLTMSLISVISSLSFIICSDLFSIVGWSKITINNYKKQYFSLIKKKYIQSLISVRTKYKMLKNCIRYVDIQRNKNDFNKIVIKQFSDILHLYIVINLILR